VLSVPFPFPAHQTGRADFLHLRATGSDAAKHFAGRGKAVLVGVNATRIAPIERLPPCNECLWTGQLRDLSNMDKHRHIVPGAAHVELVGRIMIRRYGSPRWRVTPSAPTRLTGYCRALVIA
jgi:hypothetical protein